MAPVDQELLIMTCNASKAISSRVISQVRFTDLEVRAFAFPAGNVLLSLTLLQPLMRCSACWLLSAVVGLCTLLREITM